MPEPLLCNPKLLNLDLGSRTFIITGANSGIGLVTAKQLAKQGAEVVMACRDKSNALRRIEEIRSEHPDANMLAYTLNLGDLRSVRSFVAEFLKNHDQLHGLVNNAGVMNPPYGKTVDGFELQFGVNHLGHFLLTDLLIDTLKRSAPSRIVNVSSRLHDVAMGRVGNIHFDDLNYESRRYNGWEAYAQSKLANVIHARGLSDELVDSGVTAVSLHPGWVRTRLIRGTMPLWVQNYVLRPVLRMKGMIEPWEGAQTTLHTLLDSEVPLNQGSYYSQVSEYRKGSSASGGWPMESPNPNANDESIRKRLMQVSRSLLGLS